MTNLPGRGPDDQEGLVRAQSPSARPGPDLPAGVIDQVQSAFVAAMRAQGIVLYTRLMIVAAAERHIFEALSAPDGVDDEDDDPASPQPRRAPVRESARAASPSTTAHPDELVSATGFVSAAYEEAMRERGLSPRVIARVSEQAAQFSAAVPDDEADGDTA